MLNNPVYILLFLSERTLHEESTQQLVSQWKHSSSATENTPPLKNWNKNNILLDVMQEHPPPTLSLSHLTCHLKKENPNKYIKKNIYTHITFPSETHQVY